MNYKIICPSYKRANVERVTEVLRDEVIFAVHEFEADDYESKGNDVMILPDSVKGNMAKIRNYIKDNCGVDYLVMIDDDINEIGYHENLRTYKMKVDDILELIEKGFNMMEELGTVMWGINLQADRQFYHQHRPFNLLSPVLAPFCAQRVSGGCRYDERLPMKEDYDYFLQVIHKYRKVLRMNKYYYQAGHLTNKGGLQGRRMLDEEERQLKLLQKKWGKRVVKYNIKKSVNPGVCVPIKGV